ncbi:uncharacterized protein LOC141912690 [Tubulanus polymorphus]|uniref:uncharacterized protein LOC141912690 n=1 Tax=Tubulanus polymorphus TaxID=672921 RepID=UPI003DA2765F
MRYIVVLALVCLVTVCYVQQGEAIFSCRRYCRLVCLRVGFSYRCAIVCNIRCSNRRKRDVSSNAAAEAANATDAKREITIPNNFDFFDVNEDGKISLDEFSAAMELDDDDAKFLMRKADKNEDSFVDEEEFKAAPWPFQKRNDVDNCDCKNKTPPDPKPKKGN